jgi:hypothetical protein
MNFLEGFKYNLGLFGWAELVAVNCTGLSVRLVSVNFIL